MHERTIWLSKSYCNIKNELTKDTLIEHVENINYQSDNYYYAHTVPGGKMLVSFSATKIKWGKTGWGWLIKKLRAGSASIKVAGLKAGMKVRVQRWGKQKYDC